MSRAGLVVIDRAASTVEFGGRRFPAVGLVCPLAPDQEDCGDRDRGLAVGAGDQSVYVPAENGLLIRVEEQRNELRHGLGLGLEARTCQLVWSVDEWLYLPWDVALVDGDLVSGTSNLWSWAEPEWVVETIDRVSRKPFSQPDGPALELVRLNHFEEHCNA